MELADRRVAVIGSGASAAQFVPHLAGVVGHLDVYQRTAPWLLPTDNYGNPFPPEFHELLRLLYPATGAGTGCGNSGCCTRDCSWRPGSTPSGTGTPKR